MKPKGDMADTGTDSVGCISAAAVGEAERMRYLWGPNQLILQESIAPQSWAHLTPPEPVLCPLFIFFSLTVGELTSAPFVPGIEHQARHCLDHHRVSLMLVSVW